MIALLKDLQAAATKDLPAAAREHRLREAVLIRPRVREAVAGVGVFSLAKYTRAMNQLDAGCLRANPNWRPWGTRSIEWNAEQNSEFRIQNSECGEFHG